MLGSVDSYDALARDLAEASRMIVVAVGYRKAPEVQFPGPIKVRVAPALLLLSCHLCALLHSLVSGSVSSCGCLVVLGMHLFAEPM